MKTLYLYVRFVRKQIIQRVNGSHIYLYVYVRTRQNISIQSAYLFKHRMTKSDLGELFQFADYKTFLASLSAAILEIYTWALSQ